MMMKKVALVFAVQLMFLTFVQAQGKIYTKTGTINFDATADLEKIAATNKKVTAVIDTKSGAMEFAVLMKSFEFEKALMEEHFNENYVESDTYPKATFKGTISNLSDIKFTTDGTYTANVTGNLTMHGVTKPVTTTGTFTVKNGKVTAKSTFKVLLSDYNITIPSLVAANISKEATITVDLALEPLPQ